MSKMKLCSVPTKPANGASKWYYDKGVSAGSGHRGDFRASGIVSWTAGGNAAVLTPCACDPRVRGKFAIRVHRCSRSTRGVWFPVCNTRRLARRPSTRHTVFSPRRGIVFEYIVSPMSDELNVIRFVRGFFLWAVFDD